MHLMQVDLGNAEELARGALQQLRRECSRIK